MSQEVLLVLNLPDEAENFRFPSALDRRLHELLDKQDDGVELTDEEREEAEGLVEMAEMLSNLRARAVKVTDLQAASR